MWKKIIYVLSGALIVTVLVAGVATAAYADDGANRSGQKLGIKLLERVAQILNIDKQKLTDAVKQAGTEMRQEGMNTRMDKWVTNGKLTQDQANQYKAWLASKPAGVGMLPAAMDKQLKAGKITQAQYDTWKAWWDKKPAVELPKPEKPLNKPLRKATGNVN
jgi:hypothetical protein